MHVPMLQLHSLTNVPQARGMRSPSGVRAPVLSRAPSTHNWYMVCRMLSRGGGSMKAKSSRLSTRRLFSSSTTFPRLVRWISGTLADSISARKADSVKRRQQVPAACPTWSVGASLQLWCLADSRQQT